MSRKDSLFTLSKDTTSVFQMPSTQRIIADSTDTAGSLHKYSNFKPRPSILTGSEKVVDEIKINEKNPGNIDWITIHLVIVLAVIAWVRVFFGKRLRQVIKSFTGGRNLNILAREGNIFTERISIALLIVYLISFSILIYLFITRIIGSLDVKMTGFKLFALIILVVMALWILKNLLQAFIGRVFKNQLFLTDYMLINFVSNINFGILLIPVVMLAVFLPSETMIWAGTLLWGIIFNYRLFRLFFTGLEYRKFSLFNRFLYLCTFEIAPFLVLTKLVLSVLRT